jgi:hypothetical protein
MQENTKYAYKTSEKVSIMHKYTALMHKNGGYVSAFKARRSDNSDDT